MRCDVTEATGNVGCVIFCTKMWYAPPDRARGADFQVGGLTRTRKREPTRGVRGHAPPGKFEILFF